MQEDICCASTFATFSCIGFILLVIVLFQKWWLIDGPKNSSFPSMRFKAFGLR
jgi:hypothetical protein